MINHNETKQPQIFHVVILGIFFVIHFAFQIFLLLIGIVTSMIVWETPSNFNARVLFDVIRILDYIITFPTMTFIRFTSFDRAVGGLWGYIPLLVNSALWTLALSLLLKKRTR